MSTRETARSWTRDIGRRRPTAFVVALVIALAAIGGMARSGASWGATSRESAVSQSMIVRAVPGGELAARRAVLEAGGTVGRRLAIVNGFVARVPRSRVGELRAHPLVVSVTLNRSVKAMGADYSGVSATDVGTMANVAKLTGAVDYWSKGFTGKGIDIALIDTGVAPVDGLTAPGKVINGPDLSFDSQSDATRYLDGYGHGTHLAGIMAGRADAAVAGAYGNDKTSFLGMAPDARVVNVKVGDAEGAVDISQVIAAVDWVVQHRHDAGLNIRVLTIAYGTDSTQPYTIDPLAFAVEQAVKAGIVVVAAAGNAGFSKDGTLQNPASSPATLAVGASDSKETLKTNDDVVASFSSVGDPGAKGRTPDIVAPGAHIISLRAPGSYADLEHPSGYVTESLFRGSGTSQAAAVVAGAAALIIEQRPTITPASLKRLLTNTASSLKGSGKGTQGAGLLNLSAAIVAAAPTSVGWAEPAKGGGSLESARGSLHVATDGVELRGEQDIFGVHYDSVQMAALQALGSSWSGGLWNGSTWSGSSWSGSSWSGSSWSGSSWSGSSWSGSSWSGSSWSGSSWSGSSWSASSWSAAGWLGASWG